MFLLNSLNKKRIKTNNISSFIQGSFLFKNIKITSKKGFIIKIKELAIYTSIVSLLCGKRKPFTIEIKELLINV